METNEHEYYQQTKNGNTLKIRQIEPKENYNRDFKGVWIPKNIWLDKKLTWMEKLFLVEINSLDNDNGCFASNSYFADFFDLSNGRVSQIINSIIKKEYVSVEYILSGKEIKHRVLRILKDSIKKTKDSIKKTNDGYLENDKYNNTLINNTINNTDNIYCEETNQNDKIENREIIDNMSSSNELLTENANAFSLYPEKVKKDKSERDNQTELSHKEKGNNPPNCEPPPFTAECREIIDYFNTICQTNFRHNENNYKLIRKLLKDNFTIEEIKKVIQSKNDEWKNDQKMKQYIRPITIFSNKFESYLQLINKPKTGGKKNYF